MTSPQAALTSPAARRHPRAVTPDPRRRWTIAVSLLLHGMAIGLLLTTRRQEPSAPIAPSYDLVFGNGGLSAVPTVPDRAPDQPSEAPDADVPLPVPEPPAPPQPLAPPEPLPPEPFTPELLEPEPLPEPPPAPVEPAPAPSTALPESPGVIEAAPVPLPQASAVPEMAPDVAPDVVPDVVPDVASNVAPEPEPTPQQTPNSPAPTVRLAEPQAMPPALSPQELAPDLPPLTPPPPLPPQARPRQQAQQRPAPGAFPPPIDLNYGPAATRVPAPRVGSSRAIDLSLGAPKPGPNKSEAFFDIRAANVGADWAQGLQTYWRRHRYYPQQAARNGEDGTVRIELVVNRQGRVISVEIKSRSGSPWLDMAAVGTWRNAQLAPLPFENTDPTITVPLTINYLLIR